jgi:hypothetical protein
MCSFIIRLGLEMGSTVSGRVCPSQDDGLLPEMWSEIASLLKWTVFWFFPNNGGLQFGLMNSIRTQWALAALWTIREEDMSFGKIFLQFETLFLNNRDCHGHKTEPMRAQK